MKVASAAYPLDWHDNWLSFEEKIEAWVAGAAEAGADLLVFPEYAAMELSSLAGFDIASDPIESLIAVSEVMPESIALLQRFATRYEVHISAPTGPVERLDGKLVNRAHLLAPSGSKGYQDKLIPTPSERRGLNISAGEQTAVFETSIGKIGILICYDCEFPLIARGMIEAGAEILLVPSCTEAVAGFWRVRVGAMARALEGQCVVAHAPLVGRADWCNAAERATGSAAIYCPSDHGFSETGILDEGPLGLAGWALADVELSDIALVRRNGHVLNMEHWGEQHSPLNRIHTVALSDGVALDALASSMG
ncbi:MAG: carbon-nitrogen hydrolase family protein [Pseudomonadota bacterium]